MSSGCVVVTGGGTGLGRAIALRFALEGRTVAVLGRHDESLLGTSQLAKGQPGRIIPQACDVRSEEDIQRAFEWLGKNFDFIDALVNNAGGQFISPANEMSLKGWNAVIDLNLTSVFAVSRAAYPLLKVHGGCVVNISLSGVERGSMGIAHSIAARSGVLGLTRTLALEWAPDRIRLNCIAPGVMLTDGFLREGASDSAAKLVRDGVPWGRATKVEEVAALVLFLASPEGEMITGQLLFQDGGAHLGGGLHFLQRTTTS